MAVGIGWVAAASAVRADRTDLCQMHRHQDMSKPFPILLPEMIMHANKLVRPPATTSIVYNDYRLSDQTDDKSLVTATPNHTSDTSPVTTSDKNEDVDGHVI